jgi:hypothetical protein
MANLSHLWVTNYFYIMILGLKFNYDFKFSIFMLFFMHFLMYHLVSIYFVIFFLKLKKHENYKSLKILSKIMYKKLNRVHE